MYFSNDEQYRDSVKRMRTKLTDKLEGVMPSPVDLQRGRIEIVFDEILAEEGVILSHKERIRLFESVLADEPLTAWEIILIDDAIQEIVIIGYRNVFVRRAEAENFECLTGAVFDNEEQLQKVINKVFTGVGRSVSSDTPYLQAQMPDGSFVRLLRDRFGSMGSVFIIQKPPRNTQANKQSALRMLRKL